MIGFRICLPAFLAVLLSTGCSSPTDSGPGSPTATTPTATPTGSPNDPCAGAADCDRQSLGELEVSTGATESGFRSVISGPVGVAEIEWSVSGGRTTFHYKPADGVLGPEVTIDGTPADSAGVSRAAALLYGYEVASRAASAGKAGPTGGQGATARYTGPNGVANTAGCDVVHFFDCGERGGCCDAHDECINANCAGQGGCGNVYLALQAGYTDQPCDAACLQCHGAVVSCFFGDSPPGPSHCCEAGDCERPQECMIEGVVVTKPCDCQFAGIESQTPADCSMECPRPGGSCVPDGGAARRACQCCSGVLRITNADGSGECFTR